MSLTRREFLLGTGAGFVLPSFFDRAFAYFQNHGEPLLAAPKRPEHTLYANNETYDGGFELLLDEVEPEIPDITLREYALNCYSSLEEYVGEIYAVEPEEADISLLDWDELVDSESAIGMLGRYWFPSGAAYGYLEHLDLGQDLNGLGTAGGLDFIDGASPGNDYLGVHARCPVSLSLLQHRLSELGKPVRIEVI